MYFELREEVTALRKLHNAELYNLCASENVVKVGILKMK
jgi:hypothetical protein